jgi:hypothetical protein
MATRLMLSTPITEEEEEEIQQTSAQLGLVLTATSKGKIAHRLGARLLENFADA